MRCSQTFGLPKGKDDEKLLKTTRTVVTNAEAQSFLITSLGEWGGAVLKLTKCGGKINFKMLYIEKLNTDIWTKLPLSR